MKETEITVQVFNSHNEIKEKLSALGFLLERHFLMRDFYFIKDSSDLIKDYSYKKLLENTVLVRNLSSENSSKSLLIYKNKQIDESGNVISEEKISTKIDDMKSAISIFERAGLNNWCEVEQDSYVYTNGSIEFCLQIVKDLGIFIEYEEDDSMQNLDEYEKIFLMKQNLQKLGLKLGDDYSCKKVYMKYKNIG